MMLASSISRSAGWRLSRMTVMRSFSNTTAVQEQYDVVVVGMFFVDDKLFVKKYSCPAVVSKRN